MSIQHWVAASAARRATSRLVVFACAVSACEMGATRAQEAQQGFFAHKTVSMTYGAPAGGVLDLHAQLLARHFANHIPGAPTIVVSAMPGAASKVLARRIFAAARKDGTELGELFPAALLDPVLGDSPSGYDPREFSYLGSSHYEAPVCLLRKDAPAKSFADMLMTPVTMAVSAPGSPTFDFPAVLNGILGAKINLIRGYPGGQEMALAMERGEVNGTCGSWSQLRVRYPGVLKGDLDFRVVVHGDDRADSDLSQSGAASVLGQVKNAADRAAITFFLASNAFASPFVLPPGVPADRLATLRRAFDESLEDPALLGDAKRVNLDVAPQSGADTEASVRRLFQTDPAVTARLKNALR